LMLATGEGWELRRPLGIAIVGGLMVSQWLTLYTTPGMYLVLARVRGWRTSKRGTQTVVGTSHDATCHRLQTK